MNRLFEIATELSEISRKRQILRNDIRKFELSIKAAEIELIPEGGWPGSNDMQRKAAEATSKANDPALIYLRYEMDEDQSRMDLLEVDREALISEREAWQWTIRDRETIAMGMNESVFDVMAAYRAQATQPETTDTKDDGNPVDYSELRQEPSLKPTYKMLDGREDDVPL
jgi:hypothetical protein